MNFLWYDNNMNHRVKRYKYICIITLLFCYCINTQSAIVNKKQFFFNGSMITR